MKGMDHAIVAGISIAVHTQGGHLVSVFIHPVENL